MGIQELPSLIFLKTVTYSILLNKFYFQNLPKIMQEYDEIF